MFEIRLKHSIRLAALLVMGATAGLTAQEIACPDPADGSVVVRGFVQEVQASFSIDGALVIARWSTGKAETRSQAGGAFELCQVPAGVPLVLQASLPPYQGPGVHIEPGDDGSAVMLTLDFKNDAVGTISSRVVGRLIDRETLAPISNALVGNATRGYTQISDDAGRFLLTDLYAGEQTIKVRHIAYGERESIVSVPPGTLEIEIRLTPVALVLEPLEIRVVGVRSVKLERSGFYERQEWGKRLGLGHYLTRLDIERRAPSRVSHLLSEVPRVDILRRGCSGPQCSIPFIRGSASDCQQLKDRGGELVIGASLYVDGHRTRMAVGGRGSVSLWGVDELMMPADVAGIEVYTGAGDLPAEFADSNAQRCGAIVIWTGA